MPSVAAARQAVLLQPSSLWRHQGALCALVDLWRLAEEFDERSREVGELYPAAEFVAWLKPELDGLEG